MALKVTRNHKNGFGGRSPWKPIFLTIGAVLVSQLLVAAVLIVYMLARHIQITESGLTGFEIQLSMAAEVIFGLLAFWFIRRGKLTVRAATPTVKWVLIILASVVVLQVFGTLAATLTSQLFHLGTPADDILVRSVVAHHRSELILLGVYIVILAPVCEELLFRGYLFNSLFKENGGRWGFWASAVVSGMVFALAHMEIVEFIPLTVVGIFLAWLFHKNNNNIVVNIITHALVNLSALVLSLVALGK